MLSSRTATSFCVSQLSAAIMGPISLADEVSAGSELRLIDWMRMYRQMLSPTRAFDVSKRAYLRELYELPSIPRRLVIRKAAQIGATELIFSIGCFRASEAGDTVLYLFPNDTLVSGFSSSRFGEAFQGSVKFQELLTHGSEMGGVNQVKIKRIGNRGGTLLLRGAKLDGEGKNAGLISVSADMLIVDEVNATNHPDTVVALGQKRLLASSNPTEIYASTPTYEDYGITRLYEDSTQHEWMVTCVSCSHAQAISIENVVTGWTASRQPTEWHTDEDGTPVIKCRCGSTLDQRSINAGRWEPQNGENETVGYFLHGLLGNIDLASTIRDLQSYNQSVVAEAWNQSLGVEYSPQGVALTDTILRSLTDSYSMFDTPAVDTVCMGVDVGSMYHVVVRGQMGDYRPLLWAEAVKDTSDVLRLIERFNPDTVVVDANPERRAVTGIQDKVGIERVFLCFYSNVERGELDPKDDTIDFPIKVNWLFGHVNADRTRSLDSLYSRYFNGSNILPGDVFEVRDYADQLKAPKRVTITGANGQQRAVYDEGSRPDHYAHAENYCEIAFWISNLKSGWGSEGSAGVGDEGGSAEMVGGIYD